MDVDELFTFVRLEFALRCRGLTHMGTVELGEKGRLKPCRFERALETLESLRSRLRQDREAVQKVRDEMGKPRTVQNNGLIDVRGREFEQWLAALDEVLKEGT